MMDSLKRISILFYIAAFYDGILGIAFLLLPAALFHWFQVTPPNHYGYIRFPAAILLVFTFMFLAIAKNPVQNRSLILYGILFKASYCAVVFGYWFRSNVPAIWKPFAAFDFIFMIFFVWAYKELKNIKIF